MIESVRTMELYLIKKLHQITAAQRERLEAAGLYLIKKLHQITAYAGGNFMNL